MQFAPSDQQPQSCPMPVGIPAESRSMRRRSLRRSRPANGENVGSTERIVSGIGGAALIIAGLRARTFSGLIGGLVGAELVRRGITGHCMLYDQLGMDTSGKHEGKAEQFFKRGIHVDESVTIQRPREEIYHFWRNFENLPRFMGHLNSVEIIDDRTSRWVAKAPAGYSVEWNAEIINEEPGELIAWRSLLGADVDNRGAVRFREGPQGRGTEVRVTLEYIPPAGRLGAAVAGLFGEDPEHQVRDDLRRLREILETGEIATIEGQTSGRLGRQMRRDVRDTPEAVRAEQPAWSRPAPVSDTVDSVDPRNAAAGPDQTGFNPDDPDTRRAPETLP